MALSADDYVMNFASVNAIKWPTGPLIGRVEDVSSGIVVDWADGNRQTYADDTTLLKVLVASSSTALFSRARVGATYPNPGGRGEGVIVSIVGIEDNVGNTIDVAVLEFDSGGFIALPTAAFVILS